MGLALALVPIVLFPLLKKYNEVLAMGYVVFRGALETALYIGMTIGWLMLIVLSQEYVKAGAPAASYFQTLGTLLLAGNEATEHDSDHRLQPERADALHGILSIETHPALDYPSGASSPFCCI